MNYDDSIRVKLEDGSFLKIWSNDVIARTVGNETTYYYRGDALANAMGTALGVNEEFNKQDYLRLFKIRHAIAHAQHHIAILEHKAKSDDARRHCAAIYDDLGAAAGRMESLVREMEKL